MKRYLSWLMFFGLVATACGGAASVSEEASVTTTTTTATASGETSAATELPSTSTTVATAPEDTGSDRTPAPDFSLELSDGSTFALSDQQKPVYMVFWAEW